MAHFDHIGFTRSNHGTSSSEATGGHSFGSDVTSLRGLAPTHPRGCAGKSAMLLIVVDVYRTLNWGLPRVVLFSWSSSAAAF